MAAQGFTPNGKSLVEKKDQAEITKLAGKELEELRAFAQQASKMIGDSEFSPLDETRAGYLLWHTLISQVVVALATKSAAKKPSRGTPERRAYDASIVNLNQFMNTLIAACPQATLQHVPQTGVLAGKTFLYYLAEHNIDIKTLVARLTFADLNWQHKETGNTALFVAASHDHFMVVQDLVAAGAAADIKNLTGNLASAAPGIFAAENSKGDSSFGVMTRRIFLRVEFLNGLASGLDTSSQPPLPITDKTNFDTLLGNILNLGGRLTQRNQAGQTPYDIARTTGKLSSVNIGKLKPTLEHLPEDKRNLRLRTMCSIFEGGVPESAIRKMTTGANGWQLWENLFLGRQDPDNENEEECAASRCVAAISVPTVSAPVGTSSPVNKPSTSFTLPEQILHLLVQLNDRGEDRSQTGRITWCLDEEDAAIHACIMLAEPTSDALTFSAAGTASSTASSSLSSVAGAKSGGQPVQASDKTKPK